jgi:hypothetical protein
MVPAWRISSTFEEEFCVEALIEAAHRFGSPEIINTDQARSSPAANCNPLCARTIWSPL